MVINLSGRWEGFFYLRQEEAIFSSKHQTKRVKVIFTYLPIGWSYQKTIAIATSVSGVVYTDSRRGKAPILKFCNNGTILFKVMLLQIWYQIKYVQVKTIWNLVNMAHKYMGPFWRRRTAYVHMKSKWITSWAQNIAICSLTLVIWTNNKVDRRWTVWENALFVIAQMIPKWLLLEMITEYPAA